MESDEDNINVGGMFDMGEKELSCMADTSDKSLHSVAIGSSKRITARWQRSIVTFRMSRKPLLIAPDMGR